MASTFRPCYTRPLPANAEVRFVQGKKIAKWPARGGKAIEGEVLPTGRVRVLSAVWWIEYRNHLGERVRAPGYRDRTATKSKAAELERRAIRVRAGLEAPTSHDGTGDTLAELADSYRDYLESKDRAAYHVSETRRRIGVLLNAAGLGRAKPGQVNGHHAADVLLAERRRLEWSPRTYNLHATSARAFGRWMARRLKLPANPFDPIEMLNAEAGRTRDRRSLDDVEFAKLLASAAAGPKRYGMTGPERAVLYVVAAYTGLRIGELAVLTPENFLIESGIATAVTLAAADAKDRWAAALPIPSSRGREIGEWLAGKTPGEKVFRGWNDWYKRGFRMVEEDLAVAGIPYKDAAGQVFDFHALRGLFITNLALAGVSLAEAQQLARHSTPTLTANTYTKVRPHLRAAADKLK